MSQHRNYKSATGRKFESHFSAMPSTEEVIFDKAVVNLRQDVIGSLLDEMKEKLKVALLMSHIYKNADYVFEDLRCTEFKECADFLMHVVNEHRRRGVKMDDNYIIEEDQQLQKLIEMFLENPKLLQHLPEEAYANVNPKDKRLVNCLDTIKQIALQHFKADAEEELKKEKKLEKLYHDKETMHKYIQAFQAKLRSQQINMRWKFLALDGVLKKKENEINAFQQKVKLLVNYKIEEETKRLKKFHHQAKNRLTDAKERLEQAERNLEMVMKNNLKSEDELRHEKNKLEIQLRMLINKYDQNICDKMHEKMSLNEGYQEAKQEFDAFMEEYTDLERAHRKMVQLKSDTDQQRREEKVRKFIWNRAARIIQRAWRAFIKNKKRAQPQGKRKSTAAKQKSKMK